MFVKRPDQGSQDHLAQKSIASIFEPNDLENLDLASLQT
jgi:hypothetical protein